MAIDKAVDSAALEADLTTVANAIRAKAETTGTMTFPDGMAAAVAAISTGSRIATGSVTLSGYNSSVSVTGLGFKPSRVIIVASKRMTQSSSYPVCVLAYDSGITGNNNCAWGHAYYSSTGVYYQAYGTAANNSGVATFDSDGFTLADFLLYSGAQLRNMTGYLPSAFNYIAIE